MQRRSAIFFNRVECGLEGWTFTWEVGGSHFSAKDGQAQTRFNYVALLKWLSTRGTRLRTCSPEVDELPVDEMPLEQAKVLALATLANPELYQRVPVTYSAKELAELHYSIRELYLDFADCRSSKNAFTIQKAFFGPSDLSPGMIRLDCRRDNTEVSVRPNEPQVYWLENQVDAGYVLEVYPTIYHCVLAGCTLGS